MRNLGTGSEMMNLVMGKRGVMNFVEELRLKMDRFLWWFNVMGNHSK